jgi:hypothetical protein
VEKTVATLPLKQEEKLMIDSWKLAWIVLRFSGAA